ncbi:MAG: erythromycin esterase family protein [Mariniphaga sp.]|jgi:erythromycin esterase-like protein|nr:erythromycin esterase family protein [Mariniphaga sp.]
MSFFHIFPIRLLQFLIFLSVEICFCQNYDFYNKCNFSFEKKIIADNPWNADYDENGTSFYDSFDYTEGKYSMVLTSRGMLLPFNSSVFQYLTLPALSDKIEITIDSKSQNISSAWLKVACLNKEEKIILMDSVSIVSPKAWKTSSFVLQTKNIQYLYIEIQVESNSTVKGFKKQNIDNLNIKYNNIGYNNDINIEPSPSFSPIYPIEIGSKANNYLDSISDLKKHKILAIGESVHGSDECQELVYEFIKYQITKNGCRLIMFEMPFNLGLLVNSYIGGTNIEIEKELMIYNCNIVRFIEFIDWIKAHNSQIKDKVLFLGIDNNTNLIDTDYFGVYLKNRNSEKDSLQMIYDFIVKGDYKATINYIKKYNVLNHLEKKKQKIFIYELEKLISERNKSYQQSKNERDNNMFKNVIFGITKLLADSSTAVIYGHLAHVNKVNSYMGKIYNPSLGYHMKKRFGEQYFVIALLLGEGEITSNEKFIRKYNCKIYEPTENSIERICRSVSKNDFYSKISNNIPSLTCRIIGLNYSTRQFYPTSAKNRFDALFYIKNSSGFKYPENWPKTIDEYLKNKTN